MFESDIQIYRCSICNLTNNPEVCLDLEDCSELMAFVPDPKNKLFYICMECSESINSLKKSYEDTSAEDEDIEIKPFRNY